MAAKRLRVLLEKDDALLDLEKLRRLSRAAEREAAALKRREAFAKERAGIEKDVLREEIRSDMVDREANAARVAERQRILFGRTCALAGQLSSNDSAATSANYIEKALSSLCPNYGGLSSGCERLRAE